MVTGPGRNKGHAIFIWFSGHGHTLEEADGTKLGYLVPVDAPDPDRDLHFTKTGRYDQSSDFTSKEKPGAGQLSSLPAVHTTPTVQKTVN